MFNSSSEFETKLSVVRKVGTEFIRHPEMVATVFGSGKTPIVASIDVTHKCNLDCDHCYRYGKKYQEKGTSNSEFLGGVRDLKAEYPGLIHCTWVGGEPMLRKKSLQEAVKLFPVNWIVTNGTVPLSGEWPGTSFFVSIDGTEQLHNRIRKPWHPVDSGPLANVYQTAKKNVREASAPIFVHTVINQMNIRSIPELVREWKTDGVVRGFAFSLHTPIVDATRESGMVLEGEDRREVADMLLELKGQYGNFIILSEGEIRNYYPENQLKVWGKRCRLPEIVYSADSKFQRKEPCVMGPGMDCDRCGCVIPNMVSSVLRGDISALQLAFKTLH